MGTMKWEGIGSEQVILVTAGAGGIGRCIAESFLACGARVHIGDICETAIEDFLRHNPRASASVVDVSDVNGVNAMFDELIKKYNRLDALINNAGIAGPTAPVQDIEPAQWDATVAVDLNAQFYCTRRAIPLLKQTRGSIVNMSSNAAFFGFPLRSPYTACKWALIGFTKTLAMELGDAGVRVNALCPGSVAGERIDAVIRCEAQTRGVPVEAIRATYARQSSMNLFVTAQDVANMALFLVSTAGASISGQALGIDGHTESLSSHSG